MTPIQRLITGLVLCVLVMGAAVAWCGSVARHSRHLAITARNDLLRCRQLEQELRQWQEKLSTQPKNPVDQITLTQRLQEAARIARMPMTQLQLVRPMPLKRLGQTDVMEQDTEVALREVTLEQAISLCIGLAQDNRGLQIQSLRLTSPMPPSREPGERWNVNMTLSTCVIQPLSRNHKPSRGPK
ncbi:MAG: hypothetical protein IT440_10900 [Phycisphaeraceae bacterium]|nr:hypothetical protein [Phycisphaeraceae bacterium]